MTCVLTYRPRVMIDELKPGECTIHRCSNASNERWWQLWFLVPRDTDGALEDFCVPISTSGYSEGGAAGRTWGVSNTGGGQWAVSPSINVLASGDAHDGSHAVHSIWHHIVVIVGVPDGEAWQKP